MEASLAKPTLKYDPNNPHLHYLAACRAVDDLFPKVSYEKRSEILRLIANVACEAFSRGMDPDRAYE